MRSNLTTLLLSLAAAASLLVVPASAQSGKLVADIPFPFTVQHQTMPAGQYDVSRISPSTPVYEIRKQGGSAVIAAMNLNLEGKPGCPSLTFARYGNEYALAKITPADSPLAYGLSKSAIEKSLHRKIEITSMISVPLTHR